MSNYQKYLGPKSVIVTGLLSVILSACSADRVVSTGATYPRLISERHPIVLTDTPKQLDVFVNSPRGLDERQMEDVKNFASDYRHFGRGQMIAQIPAGPRHDAYIDRTVSAIRRALGGVPLSVSRYAPSDPSLASPVRLTYYKMQAKVASQCGLWPQDLGLSDVKFNYNNEPYWNLGCATQSNIASQIADPIDLVRGRSEGLADTRRRTRDIETLRQGQDPSTKFNQDQNKINQAVGN